MNKIRRALAQFLTCLAAFCPLVPPCIPLVAAATQTGSPSYTGDSSDWWSVTRRANADDDSISQHREPPTSTFQILGLKIDETLGKVTAKLGKATVIQRGDASTGRSQICYSSLGGQKTYLIFEKGEVNDAVYLFSGGPDWKGSDLCGESSLVTKDVSTASGLHLGQTTAQVRAILGKPSAATAGNLVYFLVVEKKSSAADFEKLKRQNPGTSHDELHRNYDFYALGVYIEGRFVRGKLTYLAISKTESY